MNWRINERAGKNEDKVEQLQPRALIPLLWVGNGLWSWRPLDRLKTDFSFNFEFKVNLIGVSGYKQYV